MSRVYKHVVFLLVRKRAYGAYSDRELVVKALDARPAIVPPGHYVVPVRLHVPAACLSRYAVTENVIVPEPPVGITEVCEVKS